MATTATGRELVGWSSLPEPKFHQNRPEFDGSRNYVTPIPYDLAMGGRPTDLRLEGTVDVN
jgi:hypothetical protein